MDTDWVQADSSNLPVVDVMMVAQYFATDSRYFSAETKGIKTTRACRESYGDSAVGFVELRRKDDTCEVRCKIIPEHKVTEKGYTVTMKVEEEKQVLSVDCHDCAASQGGCKHAVAFLMWCHRRSEEPSRTSVTCYWKKPTLAKVTAQKFLTLEDVTKKKSTARTANPAFLQSVLKAAKVHNSPSSPLSAVFSLNEKEKLSMHNISIKYKSVNNSLDVSSFLTFCEKEMTCEACAKIPKITQTQANDTTWHSLRYGRITASKIHEVAHCKTKDGSLFEMIMGCRKLKDNAALKRGRLLEPRVLEKVKKISKMDFKCAGLHLCGSYPMFGASPDGINDAYVVEIKCPLRAETVCKYLKNNCIQPKFKAQIQLQMMLSGRKKGLFCVASPSFEEDLEVKIIELDFDEPYIRQVMQNATTFWINYIFPILIE